MSSTAYQGLQTCLEPRVSESNILMHKSSPPKSNLVLSFSFMEEKTQEKAEKIAHHEKNTCIGNCEKLHDNCGNLGGWSFIQTLCNNSNTTKHCTTETEQVYIHPLVKNNASTLSSMSLEMCTESLGSENGSNISDNSDEFSSILMETDNYFGTHQSKPRERARKFNRKVEFPPPLTSISGANGVQVVRPHREGGRLVLEAVTIPPCNPYFQAERVDGRLRLSFLKDEEEEDDINEEEIDGLEVEEEHEVVEERKCNCKDINYDGEEDDGNDGSSKDGMERKNDGKVGCEIELGEFQRLSKCKEGGNRKTMTNCWESYCLAIS